VRRCSASCTWLDDDFYRAESASSCDDCDDSGMGLGEEIPFATSSTARNSMDDAWRAFGDARGEGGRRVLSDGSNPQGAEYLPPIILGYGDVYVSTSVRTTANAEEACTAMPLFCRGL